MNEPVVFLHGLCASKEVWREQLAYFWKKRPVMAYDQLGHGEAARAPKYTVDLLAGDLERRTRDLGKFWLVGHSMAGTVVSAFAAAHPERLAGLVYLDAVGDMSKAPPEMRAWFSDNASLDRARVQAMFGEMLGPLARPVTREVVMAGVAACDWKVFPQLREDLIATPRSPGRFAGPIGAIEVEDIPVSGSRLPGARRIEIRNVSHWFMLDDPQATNAALDEVFTWTR